MNNTKTIFKSLLIMIVAISLFTVSCSKDEGGTKAPTNPTPKDSATLLTDILKGLGPLNGTGGEAAVTMVDLSNINPKDGSATIGNANKNYTKVKTALDPVLKKSNFKNGKIELTKDAQFPVSDPTGSTSLDIELVFKAIAPYEFDTTITKPAAGAKKYIYKDTDKTATLTLKITPEGGSWQ